MSSPKYDAGYGDRTGSMPYIPLSEEKESDADGQSIGMLVRDATQHLSTLFRAELELAKTETVGEAKKAAKGSVLFVIAAVIALYSSFFFFFFLGELLSEWLQRWAAFGIVFLVMLVAAALLGLLGYRKWKKVRAPQRSIDSLKESASVLKPRKPAETFETSEPTVTQPGMAQPGVAPPGAPPRY